MGRIFSLLLVALLLGACASTASRKDSGVDIVALHEFTAGLKTARVVVNGQPLNMIFDTGAGLTVLTPQAAARVGCKTFAEDSGFRNDGMRLDLPICGPIVANLGSATVNIPRVAVGAFFGEPPPVDGMISLHALAETPFELDISNNQIILHPEGLAPARIQDQGWVAIPMRTGGQAGGDGLDLFIGITAGEHQLWVAFDTGSSEPLLLRPTAAKSLGVNEAKGQANIAFAKDLILTAQTETREKLIYDGLLGGPDISKYRWLFDLAHHRAWIHRNP